ncbi:UvrD-helicase domain-containing protein [Polaromonas vacuolata]|nr:UvrD-helicase domain-containing protein [Polaromonas vacuolata]
MTQAAYFHNEKPVSAQAFYAIACDPRRSVAVEACAGAGKTWMLVSRILRALLEGQSAPVVPTSGQTPNLLQGPVQIEPHEILAITFTKKAAGEMRKRLDDWLLEFAHSNDEKLRQELIVRGVLSQENETAPNAMRDQLSKLYERVLVGGRAVQIRTFHSWFAALLRSAPLAALQQLGFPLNYELLEDDAPARALLWRRFYAALLLDAKAKSDFESVVTSHGRHQADKALQGALDKRTEFLLADASGILEQSVLTVGEQFPEFDGLNHPDDLLAQDAASRQLMLDAAKALGRASAKTFSAKGVDLERAISVGDMTGVLSALLTDKSTPRKFGENIIGIEQIRQAQELALRMLAARQQFQAWDYQQRMTRLSRLLLSEFAELKRDRGWVDMNDVERAAQTMLGDAVLSGWVEERLDARIKHLLIDEFQDTNPLQWQALSSWLSAYAGAGNAPSVFIVGDPKQSIYRFRRAEPQVFIAAKKFMRQALGGELLECDHTRRNSQAVIESVNEVMQQAVREDGFTGFRDHTSASNQTGSVVRLPQIARSSAQQVDEHEGPDGWRDSLTVQRETPEETLRTLEARQAAAWIASQVNAGLPASEIMVLSRKRAGLLPLRDELRALHIAAQVGEKTELGECCEVQDIIALIDVLVSPRHDLSLARALRSPLFSLDDSALVQIALARAETKASWFSLLQNTAFEGQSFDGLGATLQLYQGWVQNLAPHDALQAIFHHGDVLARFAAAAPQAERASVLANLRALLGMALQINGGRYVTPYALVRALKAGGVQAPASVNPLAVRLLTIHGAKGLEASAVMLLDTDTVERNAESMSVLVDWPGEDSAPRKFVFLVSESRPPACALPALEEEQAARKREELNALYVALTRARLTLAISSTEPHQTTTHSWWQRLINIAEPMAAPPLANPSPKDVAAFEETLLLADLPALPDWAVLDLSANTQTEPDSDSARMGKAMHRLLEWDAVLDQSPAALKALSAVTREFSLSAELALKASAMALCIRSREAAWAWDNTRLKWQGNEVELLHAGQTLRLDRLVQRQDLGFEGQWWVLDYKSAHQPQNDPVKLAQLQTYRLALQEIYPGTVIKAAFIAGNGALLEIA